MAHAENFFETYAASTKSAFDYWISFFPTAPMFGVEWRYGEFVMKSADLAESTDLTADSAAPATTTSSTAVAVDAVAEQAVEAPTETPELFETAPEITDPLTNIKGVGPGLEKQLHGLGIYTFAQLADLNDAQLAWLDDNLMTVKGRCIRDDWSGQAKALMN